MPIIETPPQNPPLSQGDILESVRLHATANCWNENGGTASHTEHALCLCLSRPCNLAHKPNAIVAAVEKYKDAMPADIESFEDMHGFLTEMRDGGGTPDVFYLGHLPNRDGRFCCRFDALFTIQLPPDGATREAFVARSRIATLNPDFLRDLHLRLLRAFASLGFDDYRWFSDRDLELLVSKGKGDILKAEQKLQEAITAKLAKESQGEVVNQGQLKQIANLEKEVTGMREKVQPFDDELSARLRRYQESDQSEAAGR